MFPCSKEDLAAAWRYARRDAADNFVFDVIDHDDIGRNLPHLLRRLELAIEGGHYTPSPLLSVDAPKRPYSVRPGAVVSLPDLIVLYALVRKIAPVLDAALSPAVYSYRWLPEAKGGRRPLLNDADEDEYESDEVLPIAPFAPYPTFGDAGPAGWFRGWIEYYEHAKEAARRYEFCAVGDVTAYFENVDVNTLFDRINRLLGAEHAALVAGLRQLYEFWAWQPTGATARGEVLPQGNDISLFLSNFFLSDLDRAMAEFTGGVAGRYLRYVDDFYVFVQSPEEGHRALLACDQVLRGLNLSLNPEKTKVLSTADLFADEVERWLEEVSATNENAVTNAREFIRTHYRGGAAEKWERPYLRALTTLQRADDDGAVATALQSFLADPTYKLLVKNFDYLSHFAEGHEYGEALAARLTEDVFTFPFHKHYLYRLGAYNREEAPGLRELALREIRGDAEWYVRAAAMYCLNSFSLSDGELREIEELAERESHPVVIRAALVALRQRPVDEVTSARDQILFSVAPGQENLREYFFRVATEEDLARSLLEEVAATDVASRGFLSRLPQLDLLKNNAPLREDFLAVVERELAACPATWPRLRLRLQRIQELASEAARRQTRARKTTEALGHLETVLRGSREAIIVADVNGKVQTWNKAASDLLGYAPEEVLGRPLVDVVEPAGAFASPDELLAFVAESGGSLTEEAIPLRRKDGTAVTALGTFAVITGPTGEAAGLSVILRDISAEIRAARAEQFQAAAEKILLDTSARFVAPDDLDEAVRVTLEETAGLLGAARAYVFPLAPDGASLTITHEWAAPGVAPLRREGYQIELNRAPLLKYQLLGRHAVVTADAQALPPAERETLQKRGARASLAVPFFIGGELAGLVGCDDTSRSRTWEPEETNFLFSITATVSKAIARKDTEEALRESEAKFRTFTGSAPVAIMIYQDYKCVYANAEAERITGYPFDELASIEFWELVHPEYKRIPLEGGKALERGEIPPTRREFKIVTKSGEEKWLDGRLGIIEYRGRRAALISAMDVTERKCAEEASVKSEEQYRQIVETAGEGIWIIDADARTTFVNEKMARTLGYKTEEMTGRHLFEFMDDGARRQAERYLERWRAGVKEQHDFKFRRRDGADLWAILKTSPITEGGNYAGALAMVTDITTRKRAEEALVDSEREKATILENMAELVTFMNRDLEILWTNKAAAESVGLTPEKVKGRRCYDLWFNREKPCPACHAAQVFATGTPRELEKTFRDGRVWNVRCNPVRDKAGEIQNVVEVSLDVTNRKRAEEALQRRAEELGAINDLAFELAATTVTEDIFKIAAERLREFAGARAVVITRYDPQADALAVAHIAAPGGLVAKADHVLGRPAHTVLTPVDDRTRREMLTTRVKTFASISDLTGGKIPKRLDSTLKKILGIGDITAASLRYGDEVLGTVAVFMPRGRPTPERETYENFSNVVSAALQRKRGEETLRRRSEEITAVNDLAIDLAAAATTAEMFATICTKLKELTGAVVTVTTSYDEAADDLAVNYLVAGKDDLKKGNKILGVDVRKLRFPAERYGPEHMASERVAILETLPEQALKVVPKRVWSALVKALGFGRIYELLLHHAGAMVGTAEVVMPKGSAPLPVDSLEAFAHVSAAALLRKKAEDAKLQTEERFGLLVDTMNDGFGIQDEKGVITYVNDRFCEMVRYAREELLGRSATDFLDRANAKVMREQTAKRVKERGEYYDVVWTAKDGRRVSTIVSPGALHDPEGRHVGTFATLTDITERRRTEGLLKRRIEEIAAVNELAAELAAATSTEAIYKIACERLRHITNAFATAIASFDEAANEFVIAHIRTRKGVLGQAAKILGVKPRQLAFPFTPVRQELYASAKVVKTGGIPPHASDVIPPAAVEALVKTFDLGDSYITALQSAGKLFGVAAAITRKGDPPLVPETLEAAAKVVAASLGRQKAEDDP